MCTRLYKDVASDGYVCVCVRVCVYMRVTVGVEVGMNDEYFMYVWICFSANVCIYLYACV